MTRQATATVLAVDDEAANLQLLRQVLQEQYRLLFAKDGARALELAVNEKPDLILLDVMMPGMTGYDACRALKANPATAAIPVIFVSALTDAADEIVGFQAGAVDFISKPLSPAVVKARIKLHLSLVRMEELRASRLAIVQRLGLAAEYKDNETGLHVIRMSHYARLLAIAAGFDEQEADDLFIAAPMHDIGKIGIPDHILQKTGRLTPEEYLVMQNHPAIGAHIIGHHEGGLLAMAHDVALSHHEKWDGSGYPNRLAGAAIPLAARIVAVADVFDALTSVRPYKPAWNIEDACAWMTTQRGSHFEPRLLDLFLEQLPAIRQIMERWAER
ncbi:response regulator [Pseudoduganella violaceinigra]|uniref:response regulator n=1 Tax=Pseudoduganella violaceinigra TaxID=246602 RepID=UPI00041DE897|nr:HD domain-containing phosphohydrolase [Pseudoduganella violaceinigra]